MPKVGEVHEAATRGDAGEVQRLLNEGYDVNGKWTYGETPLHCAAKYGHEGAVAVLVKAGADVNAKSDVETPLHLAASNGHEGVAGILVEAGADVNMKDYRGWFPLHAAAEAGSEGVARVLVKAGADVNAFAGEWTALHLAARSEHEAVAGLLVEAGADPGAKGEGDQTPVDVALVTNNAGVLAAILGAFIRSSELDMDAATFLAIHERPGAQMLKDALQRLVLGSNANAHDLRKYEEIAKRFIDAQISSAVGQQAVLEEVYGTRRTAHKSMYDQVMSGIKQENGFQAFVQVASAVQTILSPGGTPPTVEQQSSNVLALYAKARKVNADFGQFVSALAKKCGGEFLEAPLKSLFRSLEKIGLRAVGQWDASGLCDIVRGGVQFDKMEDMRTFFNLLCSATDAQGEVNKQGSGAMNADAAGVKTKIVIVRVKNRFDKPTSGGWSDCLVNFHLADDPDKHVCEVQLVHERLMRVRKQMGAHKQYAQFRSAMELLEATGNALAIERLDREDDEKREARGAPAYSQSEQTAGDVAARLARLERAMGSLGGLGQGAGNAAGGLGQAVDDMNARMERLEQAVASILAKLERLDGR